MQNSEYKLQVRSKTLTTARDLDRDTEKAYSSLVFCTTKFPGVESRNGNAVICWRVLVFPCTEQIVSTERGKKGRAEYPPRSRNSDDVHVNHNIHSCPATPASTPLPSNRTCPAARRGSPGFATESSLPIKLRGNANLKLQLLL